MHGLTRFMRDRDGVVHELHPNSYANPTWTSWFWPQGHVDARFRAAVPAPDATAPTCFACMEAHRKTAEFRARRPDLYGD